MSASKGPRRAAPVGEAARGRPSYAPAAPAGPVDSLGPDRVLPQSVRPAMMLGLQRAAGNAAVLGLVARASDHRPPPAAARPHVAAARPVPAPPLVQRQVTEAQAESLAGQLFEAMDGWGTDEDAIYGALSGRTQEDLVAIRAAYATRSAPGLDADLSDDLTASELA